MADARSSQGGCLNFEFVCMFIVLMDPDSMEDRGGVNGCFPPHRGRFGPTGAGPTQIVADEAPPSCYHPGGRVVSTKEKALRWSLRWFLVPLLFCTACKKEDPPVDNPVGEGLFVHGCPQEGLAMAVEVTSDDFAVEGTDGMGQAGDYLLLSSEAAFVIAGLEGTDRTYYYYGGIPIDAVAVAGCEQASPERFGEVGFLMGEVNPLSFYDTVLRGFRGDSVEILNDGADGEAAYIRVHGADDLFWVVELTLVSEAVSDGAVRPRSGPLGITAHMDYILEPDSAVLQMELHLASATETPGEIQAGAALFPGPYTPTIYYTNDQLSAGGFDVDIGVPWLASGQDEGSYAFAIQGAQGGTIYISGTEVFVDANQLLQPLTLMPASSGQTEHVTFLLAVGAGAPNTATRHLQAYNPEPIPDLPAELFDIGGQVVDSDTGEGLAGAVLYVELMNEDGEYRTLDRLSSGADGTFSGRLPDLGGEHQNFQLQAHLDGRVDPDPVSFSPGSASELTVDFGAAGSLDYDVTDGDGTSLPAKIILWQDDTEALTIFGGGQGTAPVPPGDYDVSVTRGWEYEPYQGSITIPEGGSETLAVTLEHLVDTTGYLSVDTHVHMQNSGDSDVLLHDRVMTAAAEGLEVVLTTDHEFVTDLQPAIEAAGMTDWVATRIGQEVTASLPEHITALDMPAAPEHPRGDPVAWYGMGLAEMYQASRDRGAKAVGLNHPRGGCNIMCLIGYDRLLGEPTMTDPELLGLDPGMSIWSWDLDFIEYQKGGGGVWLDPENPDTTGLLDDWLSFLNHGHRVTAIGSSDEHGTDGLGTARTYFPSSTDHTAEFVPDDMWTSIVDGEVVVSKGGFARVLINDTAGMGETITDTDSEVDLWLQVEAIPSIDVTHAAVLVNCDQVLEIPASDPDGVVKIDTHVTVPVTEDAHVVVLAYGEEMLPRGLRQFDPTGNPRATTNAIYVDVDGNGDYDHPGGKECVYDTE